MVDSERAVIDETTAGLLEAAGPQMYRRNAFRITGLPTDADRRAVRQRQQRITPALELGADVDLGHSLPVRLDDVRGAFDRILGDPRRRLVDELFWLWDGAADASTNGASTRATTTTAATAAASATAAACPCPKTLHHDHDAAVRAHSAALDLEVENDAVSAGPHLDEAVRLWSNAARLWGQVLRRAAFWDHVRHRIGVLDDRQLDESVIDTFRDAMPGTLVKPLIELAAAAPAPADRLRLAKLARDWPLVPAGMVDDQLEEAAAPHYESLRATAKRASSQLDGGNWDGAAAEAYDHALPALALLESLVPHARHRRTASARNDVAVLLNNCATAATDGLGPAANLNASKWFRTAAELATDPVTQQTVRTNRDGLRDMMTTFNQIRSQVDQLVAAGRIGLARTLLLNVKRQLAGGPGSDEIDRMLAGLQGARPGTSGPRPRRGRVLAWAVLALVVLGFLVAKIAGAFDDDGGDSDSYRQQGGTAVISAENVEDNDRPGRCIGSKSDWRPGERAVDVVPCDEAHWGEVVAYELLADTASRYLTGKYPGAQQATALARFRCELALARLGSEGKGLKVTYTVPPESAWDAGGPVLDEYTTCVAHWPDDRYMTGDDQVRLDVPVSTEPALMGTFGQRIEENAPVGSCVQTKKDLSLESVGIPIVPCEEQHWAEIVAYPVLYPDGTGEWPGNDAVYVRAKAACEEETKGYNRTMVLNVTYPAQDWWTWNAKDSPIYTMCALSYMGDSTFTGGLR
ncbi:septum formation family protein [Streptomyces sp. NPDC058595]|uniref:septum formation family protein n=1 Tax=Streptomyces sp. NPDC058595 TaxID=3346550 RepID=UPI003659C5A2